MTLTLSFHYWTDWEKKLINSAVRRLKEEIDDFKEDIIDLIEINNYGKEDLISKMKRLCEAYKKEINSIMGDFENHSLQGSASEIEEKGMPVNTLKGSDNTLGCGKYIKEELKWDTDEGYICGQYYDSLNKIFLCQECHKEEHRK